MATRICLQNTLTKNVITIAKTEQSIIACETNLRMLL